MRSIWKGDLSFGLVNVPVKVYSATESHDRKSHQVDSNDGTRIRYRKVREGTDEEVEFSQIANAYESDTGQTVVLTKDDLAELPVQRSPEISITDFVPVDQVDPIYFDKPYYLEPASKSPKADCPASSPSMPGITEPSTCPQMPATSRLPTSAVGATTMSQVLVPITFTSE